jgi:hypothetical protein
MDIIELVRLCIQLYNSLLGTFRVVYAILKDKKK